MKFRNFFYAFFLFSTVLLTTFILYNNKSYSYGISKQISVENGKKVIEYAEIGNDGHISFEDAHKYFNVPIYEQMYYNGETIYFDKGQETDYHTYIKGTEAERADNDALLYGKNAYRVHTTKEFIHAFDDIYQNLKIGEFHIIFSKYEPIDLNQVKSYYDEHYGVKNVHQNYYTYQEKGLWEPDRFSFDISNVNHNGELVLSTINIRLSGNERVILEDFVNKLIPYLNKGTDYEKILAAYTYMINTSYYFVDNGFTNDFLASYTSAYDSLITKGTNCIGYSIGFSYLMDKMGIESYIVDQVTQVNEVEHIFESVHTYNVVKLENKFYKVDLTGKSFLTAINNNELYDNALNISSTNYMGNKNISIDYDSINKILSSSKSIKTTTTKRVEGTTTIKNYPYTMPKDNNRKDTTNIVKTSIVTTKDESGNTVTVPVEISESGEIITNSRGKYEIITENTTKEKEKNKEKTRINYNYILIPLLILGLITLFILSIKDKKKKKEEQKKE